MMKMIDENFIRTVIWEFPSYEKAIEIVSESVSEIKRKYESK